MMDRDLALRNARRRQRERLEDVGDALCEFMDDEIENLTREAEQRYLAMVEPTGRA